MSGFLASGRAKRHYECTGGRPGPPPRVWATLPGSSMPPRQPALSASLQATPRNSVGLQGHPATGRLRSAAARHRLLRARSHQKLFAINLSSLLLHHGQARPSGQWSVACTSSTYMHRTCRTFVRRRRASSSLQPMLDCSSTKTLDFPHSLHSQPNTQAHPSTF